MKKILLILIAAVISVTAFSQAYQNALSPYGNNIMRGNFLKGLYIPKFNDTTDAYIANLDSLGLTIQIKSVFPNKIYFRDSIEGVGRKWTEISQGGSGSTTFFSLTDVDSSGIQDGYIPYYDLTSGDILFQAMGTNPIVSGTTTYQVQDSTNTPPVSFPSGFDTTYWMVGGAGTGIFSGNNYKIALYINGVFDSFITPTTNDWALTLDDNIWHQYDGSTWPRRNAPIWLTTGNLGGGILGSTDNTNVFFRRNNVNQIIIQNNGVRLPQLTGASAGLVGLSTVGITSNVQIGSGLQLLAGVLSSTASGSPLFPLTGTGTATGNVTGDLDGFSLTVTDAARMTISLSDSFLLGTTKSSIAATDSANVRAAVMYQKATRSFFGATTLAYIGVDSLGWMMQNGFIRGIGITTQSTSTDAYKPLQQDTATGFMIRKLIDISSSSQITGNLPVTNLNSGTSASSTTVWFGDGTWKVPFTLTTTGTSGSATFTGGTLNIPNYTFTNYWTKGAVSGVAASTNILQPSTLTDSIAAGTLTALNARYNFGGTASFYSTVAVGNFAQDANYKIKVGVGAVGSIYTTGNVQFDALASIGTAAAAIAGQTLTIAGSTTSVITGSHNQSVNSTTYNGYNLAIQNSMTTAAGGNTSILASVSNLTDQSTTQTSALYRSVFGSIVTSSGSTTPITTAVSFDSYIRGNNGASRTQTFTTVYGFRSQNIASAYPTGGMLTSGGNFYQYYADSSLAASFAGGSMWGFYQKSNTANNIKNVFQGNTLIGSGTQNASAALEVISTTQGILFPRMTTGERDAIASPTAGLVIYNTTTNKLNVYTTAWEAVTSL